MNRRKHTNLVREGDYLAEVDVELIDDPDGVAGWGPYLDKADALKLDDVRQALRRGDLNTARKHARLYRVTPLPAA